jgi:hypothetical protein
LGDEGDTRTEVTITTEHLDQQKPKKDYKSVTLKSKGGDLDSMIDKAKKAIE